MLCKPLYALAIFLGAAIPLSAASFRDCAKGCPELIRLPAGDFTMGGLPSEEAWSSMEAPRHHVAVRAFAISKYDVTFDDWAICVSEGGCNAYVPGDYGFGRGKRPIE